MSEPLLPLKVSSPFSPFKVLSPLLPIIVSSPSPPFTFSIEIKISFPSPVVWLIVNPRFIWFDDELNTAVSTPSPPLRISSPFPPLRVSEPSSPFRVSFPSPPIKLLSLLFPVTESSPPPAFTFSIEIKISLPSPVSCLLSKPRSIWFADELNTAVSCPPPPFNKSFPSPPIRASLPFPPYKLSSPSPPSKVLFRLFPFRVLFWLLPVPFIFEVPVRTKSSTSSGVV